MRIAGTPLAVYFTDMKSGDHLRDAYQLFEHAQSSDITDAEYKAAMAEVRRLSLIEAYNPSRL